MTKCVLFGAGCACIVALASATPAPAGVVADYRDDFQSGTPKAGWSYLWNGTGALESSPGVLNVAGLVPLVADTNFGGDYETQANGARPDAAPGSNLAATSTSLFPGQGAGQAGNVHERFVLAAYTISPADIAAHGAQGSIDNYSFEVPFDAAADGVSSRIYVNDALQFPGETVLPPGIIFTSSSPGAFAVPLDPPGPRTELQAGDTIYVAIGSRANDLADELIIDYSIVLVPEPAAVGLLGMATIGFLGRRRNRG